MPKARPRKAWAARLLLVLAAEGEADLGVERLRRQPGADLADLAVGQHAVLDVGRDGVGARWTSTRIRSPVRGSAVRVDHVAERHGAARRVDHQPVDLAQVARGQRIAGDDVDLVVGVVGAVGRDLQAVGDQPDGGADGGDVGAVAGRRLAVDRELPLDAGHRAAVGDVLQARQPVEEAAHLLHDRVRACPGRCAAISSWTGLPTGGPALGTRGLDQDAGEIGGAAADLGHDLAGRSRRVFQSVNSSRIRPTTSSSMSSPPRHSRAVRA